MKEINKRHGGPWDRGSADSYYRRGFDPHYYTGNSYSTDRIEASLMTEEEIAEYKTGYDDNERSGNFKDWGNDE